MPEFALVAKRLPLELSIPLQSFHFPKRRGGEQICEAARFGLFRRQRRVRTNHQVITPLSKSWEQHQR